MNYRFNITLAIIVCIIGVSPVIAADVAVNGSFENPDIPPHSIDSPAVPGWTNVAFVMDLDGGWAGIFPDAGSLGAQYADFANTRSRIASTDFTVAAGLGIVEITWDATAGGSVETPYVARLKDGLGDILLSGDFMALGDANYNTWDPATLPMLPFTYGPGNYTLEFFADQDGGSDLLADNVVIEIDVPEDAPEIPEPASLILLLGGSLLALRRKRS